MGESRCLHCLVEGQPKKEWTCACGYGYWDAVIQKFIPGSQVRSGRALSRADYEAHLQQCLLCRNKAEDDDLVLPTIEPPWSEGDYGPNARPWEGFTSEPVPHHRLPGQVEMFLPSKDIDADVLKRYIVEKVDPRGHVRTGIHTDGRSGFFITAKTTLTVDMLVDIKKKSSKAWQDPSRPDGKHSVQLPDRRRGTERDVHDLKGSQPIMVASVALGKDPQKAKKTNCLLTDVIIKLTLADHTVTALIDSGAEANVISQKFARRGGLRPGKTTEKTHAFDGHTVHVYGQNLLSIQAVDRDGVRKTAEHELLVTDCDSYDIILGYPWLEAVNADCDWRAREWRYKPTRDLTMRRRNTEPPLAESARIIQPAVSGRRGLMDQRHQPWLDSRSPDNDRPSPVDRRESLLDQRDSRDVPDLPDVRDISATRDPRDLRSSRDQRYLVDPRDARNIRDVRDPRDIRDSRHVRDIRDSRDLRYEHGRSQDTRRDQVDERSQLSRTTSYNHEPEASAPRSAAGPIPDRAEVQRQVMIRLRDSGAQVTQSQLDQAVEAAMRNLLQRR